MSEEWWDGFDGMGVMGFVRRGRMGGEEWD